MEGKYFSKLMKVWKDMGENKTCSTCMVLAGCLFVMCMFCAYVCYVPLQEARKDQVIEFEPLACPECQECSRIECQPVTCNCAGAEKEEDSGSQFHKLP